MLLRPRQRELVSKAIDALNKLGNTLIVAPTGAGKTIMMSAILGRMFESGAKRTCVLAHRDELTSQNENNFKQINPTLSTSIFNSSKKDSKGQAIFAMVQTLSRQSNLDSLPPLDVLVIDEAHHAPTVTYMRVIEHVRRINPNVRILGMTATPNRGDKKGMREVFSNVSDQITVEELVVSGHLVLPRIFVMDIGVKEELKKNYKDKLDADMDAVADIMNKRPINDAVVHHWHKQAGDRQTVVFCSNQQHAHDVTSSFKDADITTAMISDKMNRTERKDTLAAYGDREIQVIVNVAVLTEGWDDQPTSCVVLLRPSSSKSAMVQMIGRGLRTVDPSKYPGVVKKDCMVLDFGRSTLMHRSLEQKIQLDAKPVRGEAPYKDCPECSAYVPPASWECPICGYIWAEQGGQQSILTADFEMMELDIFNRSNFDWCDLHGNGQDFIATGFKVWGGVFYREGEWYAVGWSEKHGVKFLITGERAPCFAAADDWVNQLETESTAHRNKSWLRNPATQSQLSCLPQKYRNDNGITKYKASALMKLSTYNRAINQAIASARSQRN